MNNDIYTLYIGGDFTTIGGITTNGICKYDTLTSTFSALGTTNLTGTSSEAGFSVKKILQYVWSIKRSSFTH